MELIQYKEMREAIVRVRELHQQDGNYCTYCADLGAYGNPKEAEYPCPTIKALDGE
jgi:hypothetical protein